MSDLVYVNEEDGKKRVMNNDKLYLKLLNKFKADNYFDGYEESFNSGDWQKLHTIVHTIKGVAANLSFTALFDESVKIEAQIKSQSVTPELLEAYKGCFAQTVDVVGKVIAKYE